MLRVNKFLVKGSVLTALVVILVIVLAIFLPVFRNNSMDNYMVQSDTLIWTGKDTSKNHLVYLLMEYKTLNNDSVYVKRSIVKKEGVAYSFHYFMIKKNDSLVLVKPVRDYEQSSNSAYNYRQDSDSVYIDLRKEKIARVRHFFNRLNSELQFMGYERYKNKNGKQDSLIVMYGCDISKGSCLEDYKNYWYFDRNFHLRKAVAVNGIVFFIDKHYFGIE